MGRLEESNCGGIRMEYGLKNAVAIVGGNKIPLSDIRIEVDEKSYSINICTKEEIELPTRPEVSD